MRRAVLQGGAALLIAGAASLVGVPSAAAAPCNSTSGFKPQIEWPVGETLSSPGITQAAAYDGTVDFGDGRTIPISLEEPFEHTFTEPGTYTVTSTGSGTAFTSDGGTVPCEENRFVITTVTVYPLEARMTVTRDGGSDNTPTYTFDGSGSIPEGRIDQFTWDFGDGSYGSGASASHTYATPGRFTATLSILDDRGHPASTSKAVNAGDITTIDLGEIAGRPELDPNVFAALGSDAGGSGDGGDGGDGGGGNFPWLALMLGGLFVVGAVLVLLRFLKPSASAPATQPPTTSEPPPPPVANDLPETIGDSGIVYAQEARKRDKAVKGTGTILDYFGNFGNEVQDTVDKQHAADERQREALRKKYEETFPNDPEMVKMLVDNDMAQYGHNAPMVNDVAQDALYDAPIETAKDRKQWWKGYMDLWNRTFGPKQ